MRCVIPPYRCWRRQRRRPGCQCVCSVVLPQVSAATIEVLDLTSGALLTSSPVPKDGGVSGAADDATAVCLPATGGSAVVARGALLELWALDWWLEFKGSLCVLQSCTDPSNAQHGAQ